MAGKYSAPAFYGFDRGGARSNLKISNETPHNWAPENCRHFISSFILSVTRSKLTVKDCVTIPKTVKEKGYLS